MINRVVLVGRLTRDPDARNTNSGTSVTSFTVAVDNRMKNPDGSKSTSYINCVAWNQSADVVAKYAKKGNLVGVEGRLNQRKYTNNQGVNVSVVEVICDSVTLLEKKPEDAEVAGEETTFEEAPATEAGSHLGSIDLPDDDLPF